MSLGGLKVIYGFLEEFLRRGFLFFRSFAAMRVMLIHRSEVWRCLSFGVYTAQFDYDWVKEYGNKLRFS